MPQSWITGVNLRTDCLEWTILRRSKEGWTVFRRGSAKTEDGRPLDGPFLKSLHNPFRGAVVIGVPLEDLMVQVVRMPSQDPEELRDMAELQIEKFSPYPLDSVVYGVEALATQGDDTTLLAMATARVEKDL